MTIFFGTVIFVLIVLFVSAVIQIRKLNRTLIVKESDLALVKQQSDQLQAHYKSEALRVQQETNSAIANAQQALDQELAKGRAETNKLQAQLRIELERVNHEGAKAMENAQRILQGHLEGLNREADRIRAHYEEETRKRYEIDEARISKLMVELEALRKFQGLHDAEIEIKRVLITAIDEANTLKTEADMLLKEAQVSASENRTKAVQRIREIEQRAETILSQATRDASRIVSDAHKRAEQIGGDAYIALREKKMLEQAVRAIHNTIEGYGDRYIVPTHSLLDDLATDFSHTAAGASLKRAREQSRRMVEAGGAASCDYVDTDRRATAIRFVVDAFNGRVDAILSRTREDNYGTLQEEIRDAFSLVNLNGQAFRNCQILPAYLDSRLAELRYAVVTQELKRKAREEQRRIQEQIREEEKARRDYEKALKETAREEAILRTAMEKAEAQARAATDEQRAKFDEQVRELTERLKEAEARNQRAISMAQQTRRGHVYIVSNIGSFGDNIYKIGLTRRLDPIDRIRELGDSSVPFDFDVHALIFSEDAPALELKLHNHFLLEQVNKVDHRKEFFRVDIKHIREELDRLGIIGQWTMAAAAAEYRETLVIEKAITENPELKEAWLKRQFELEMLEPLTSNDAEESSFAENRGNSGLASTTADGVAAPGKAEVGI